MQNDLLSGKRQAALFYARRRSRTRTLSVTAGPTDITLSASSFDQNALSGSTVATISATSAISGATYTYSLTDDANGLFLVEGNLLKLATTLPSGEEVFLRDITIQGTLVETGGTYSETFTLSITPVDTTNDSGLTDAEGTLVPVGEFTLSPSVGGNGGNLKFKGKNAGLAYFVYDIGAVVAGEKYTFSYIPYFSELSNTGKEAFVGFGFKSGDSFHLSGLKGDGTTGLDKHKIYGTALTAGNYTSTGSGAVTHGTQSGPNWIQVEISADGLTYTLRTSADGTTWADEFTAAAPDPFADTTTPATFGLAVYLESTDKGNFSLDVTQWTYASAAATPTFWLKADEGVFTDTAGTTAAVDGNQIALVTNHGSKANFQQSTLANRPIYKTGGLNSKPYVQCTASSFQYFEDIAFPQPSGSGLNAYTVFFVTQSLNLASFPAILGSATSTDKNILYMRSTAGAQFHLLSASARVGNVVNPQVVGVRLSVPATTLNYRMNQNGTITSADTGATLSSVGQTVAQFLRATGFTAYFDGRLYELRIYEEELSDSAMDAIVTELKTKFAIA